MDSELALPLVERLDYVIQILRALRFLHEHGISHEALATKKVMMSNPYTVKFVMLGRRGGNILYQATADRRASSASRESIELLSPDMVAAAALYDEDVMAWMVRAALIFDNT